MRQTDKGKNETSEIYNDNNAKVKFIDFCLGWQKNQGLSLTDTHTHTHFHYQHHHHSHKQQLYYIQFSPTH